MCPKTVVPCGDAETGDKIPKNGENEGLPPERSHVCTNETDEWGKAEDSDIEKIQFVAPV